MKNILPFIIILFSACQLREQNGPPIDAEQFSFTVSSPDTVLSIHQAPLLEVEITNKTIDTITLVYALDGSHSQMRYPHVYYTINEQKVEWPRCGNTNPIEIMDMISVPPGGKFNPFEHFQNGLPFVSFSRIHSQLFDSVGIYDIQFHYNTNAPDIYSFTSFLVPKNSISRHLKDLVKSVPRISLSSNILSIQVVDSTAVIL
jgi:hypothetical protein